MTKELAGTEGAGMISVAFYDLPIAQIDNRVKAAYVAAIRRALPGALAQIGQAHCLSNPVSFIAHG
jgi:hypothetical protein